MEDLIEILSVESNMKIHFFLGEWMVFFPCPNDQEKGVSQEIYVAYDIELDCFFGMKKTQWKTKEMPPFLRSHIRDKGQLIQVFWPSEEEPYWTWEKCEILDFTLGKYKVKFLSDGMEESLVLHGESKELWKF